MQVRKSIGPFAAPKAVFVVDDLPKTRSGKIMRRILRKILSGEEDSLGDISTVSTTPQLKRWLYFPRAISDQFCTALRPQRCGEDHRDCPRFPQVKCRSMNFDDNDDGRAKSLVRFLSDGLSWIIHLLTSVQLRTQTTGWSFSFLFPFCGFQNHLVLRFP